MSIASTIFRLYVVAEYLVEDPDHVDIDGEYDQLYSELENAEKLLHVRLVRIDGIKYIDCENGSCREEVGNIDGLAF